MSNNTRSAALIRRICWFAGVVVFCILGFWIFGETRNRIVVTNQLNVPVTIERFETQLNDNQPTSAISAQAGTPFGNQLILAGKSFQSSFRGQPHARMRITYHIDDGPMFFHEYATIRTWGFHVEMTFQDHSSPQLTVTTSRLRAWVESHRSWLPSHGTWFD